METQTIREIKRTERAEPTVFDRLRGRRRVDPLRETADEFSVVLDRLSESVTEVMPRQGARFLGGGDDSVDVVIDESRRTRGFKLRQSVESAPVEVEPAEAATVAGALEVEAGATDTAVTETDGGAVAQEVDEVIDILMRARDVAAEAVAPTVVMPAHDRAVAQTKFKDLFLELSMKRIEIISTIFGNPDEAVGVGSAFSLSTPESAKAAYNGIDAMILKFLNAGRDEATDNSVYEGHEAAISATEQLKSFLQNESPEKAFMRFREVNRSNILGLLQ